VAVALSLNITHNSFGDIRNSCYLFSLLLFPEHGNIQNVLYTAQRHRSFRQIRSSLDDSTVVSACRIRT